MPGGLANVSYTKGIHNVKAGITYEQTFLNETSLGSSILRLTHHA